ncbi:ABC transporter ATP-binding protein [Niallia circulans]|uniref:ABC transporter ATP-binding protein n=1 Tax=Niallia circulans TaxID=1397 RepID=A0A553STE6_NIACI|nr:ABC transporter ATP-binding protein [Niallia circulans]TRZ40246.1 ABC transporter ATP-binding protein [Niallia circulans]
MSRIVLKNIKKSFKKTDILNDINLTVKSGEMVAIKGKSGIGKSTLLNIIAGLEKPNAGSYTLEDIEMTGKNLNQLASIRGTKIGYISQFSPMIPKLTAFQNIYLPLSLNKKSKELEASIEKEITEICELFDINLLLDKDIKKLSGGEIQRVGIVRSVINNPKVIIADEPTGSLDDDTALTVLEFFKQMASKGKTIIIATHSQVVAEQCDTIYHLTKSGLQQE